jgi:predicted nuclease of predicted toxin-antitoxin system
MVWRNIEALIAENPPSKKEMDEVRANLGRHAKARFYTDENFPGLAVEVLRSMRAKVRTAREVGLLSHPDENHLAYARRNGSIFLTCDRDFLNEHRFPLVHCPAIFVFDFGGGSVIEIREAFRCLRAALQMPQFFDKWWKIDAKRDSWIEYVRYRNGSTSRYRLRVSEGRLQEWIAPQSNGPVK